MHCIGCLVFKKSLDHNNYYAVTAHEYIYVLCTALPRPACPMVDLSWTGVFPCELGWRASALAVLILSAVLITCYSLITACLVRWNPRKQWNIQYCSTSGNQMNISCHNKFKRYSFLILKKSRPSSK